MRTRPMTTTINQHMDLLKGLFEKGRLFGDPIPTQRKTTNTEYGGELRGFYPWRDDKKKGEEAPKPTVDKGVWFPLNSGKHDHAADGHRSHAGIDVYAPYAPFPYEIPVLALADGEVEFVFVHDTANGMGNQANLHLFHEGFGGHIYRLIYGHLNRFIPGHRVTWPEGQRDPQVIHLPARTRIPVKQGDVIGFVGISGNANSVGEATTRQSPAGVASGHVHLQLSQSIPTGDRPPAGTQEPPRTQRTLNLEPVLPFKLDQMGDALPDNEVTGGRPAAIRWKRLNQGHASYWKPRYEGRLLKPLGDGSVSTLAIQPTKRANPKLPNLAPWPFHGLRLDDEALLKGASAAYGRIITGLTGGIGPFTKAVLEAQGAALAKDPERATRVASTLDDLHDRAKAPADRTKGNDDHRAARATAALLHLLEGLYTLMGGPGFEEPALRQAVRAGRWVSSGAGVGGILSGVASVGPRSDKGATPFLSAGYIHLAGKIASGAKVYPAISVGFGAGSAREATFARATSKNVTGSGGASSEALAAYCDGVVRSGERLHQLIGMTIKAHQRLIGDDTGPWEGFCRAVNLVANEQRTAAEHYFNQSVDDAARQRLWRQVATDAKAVIDASEQFARKPIGKQKSEEDERAMPELRLIYSETPPTPGVGP